MLLDLMKANGVARTVIIVLARYPRIFRGVCRPTIYPGSPNRGFTAFA
jgi:hypothetical protein